MFSVFKCLLYLSNINTILMILCKRIANINKLQNLLVSHEQYNHVLKSPI